ncbi:MAG: adenosine deaminase [Acidimicrobiaceae bacterium]|nr:adenosine deaminase [Acidimicrobiaceae bacterium]MXW74433.1 adenosine deaminase [Acidimicrobiaceae bacterium]MYA75340.1 adenosine deaminase [Acidimicrobiaceae bacterium]MYC41965.1 adenosine deaminase [Acidimicrobiaceae bacterium]MYD08394.1 adenosine deaminase [Acidimicrobiaceae bacterium]
MTTLDVGAPTLERIRSAPKVLLHDHLDGGLRPTTIIELADELGYRDLPATEPGPLVDQMTKGANRKDLALYLETFAHTIAVMQTPDSINRVARECAEDLAADGVVYAEVRFAPELHRQRGLSLDDAIEAVLDGFAAGSSDTELNIRAICTAMRNADNSLEVAQAAVRWRDRGVVGFDIAGAEDGFPPDDHIKAFQFCQRENFHITVHAGEAYGPRSIWKAVQYCGSERLGHGIRIIEDISDDEHGEPQLSRLAHFLRDRRIPLEICPTSNVNTGVVDSIAEHPIDQLIDLRFRVTLNTDNRLMSGVTVTSEMAALVDAFDYGWDRLRWLTVNGMKSSFLPFSERLQIIEQVIKPRYAPLEAWSQDARI